MGGSDIVLGLTCLGVLAALLVAFVSDVHELVEREIRDDCRDGLAEYEQQLRARDDDTGYVLVTEHGVEIDLLSARWSLDEIMRAVDGIEQLPEVAF